MSAAGEPKRALGARVRAEPHLAIGAGVIALLGLVALLRKPEDWEVDYLPAGRRLLAGADPYEIVVTHFPYPPAMVFVSALASLIPPALGRLAWVLSNVVALAVLGWTAWRASGGGRALARRELAVFLLGGGLALRFLTDAIEHRQTDVWIGALVAAASLACVESRWVRAGVSAGLAASLKATPVAWLPYLLFRGRLVAALAMTAVLLGASLLPDAIASAPGGGLWLSHWVSVVVVRPASLHGEWMTAPIYNQSLAGMLHRWLALSWPVPGQYGGVPPRVVDLDVEALAWAVRAARAAVVSIAAFAIGRARPVGRVPREALDASVICLSMLLLSPASSKGHFVVILIPAFCLARLAILDRDRIATATMAVAVLCAVASHRTLVGTTIGDPAQWAGAITVMAVALLLGCALAGRRDPSLAPGRPAGTTPSCRP